MFDKIVSLTSKKWSCHFGERKMRWAIFTLLVFLVFAFTKQLDEPFGPGLSSLSKISLSSGRKVNVELSPDYMTPVRTLTGTIKFTWAWSESMKWLHETGTRLQIGMNVYMKHTGSSYFSFVVYFIVPYIVKCSNDNKYEYNCQSSSRSSAFCYCFLKIGPKFFHFSLYSFVTQFDRFLLKS